MKTVRALVGALVATVLLAGCSSGAGTPRPADPVASRRPASVAPTTSTTTVPPERKAAPARTIRVINTAAATRPPTLTGVDRSWSVAGALGFVRYWIETINWAYATLDTEPARAAYLTSCAWCRDFISRAFTTPVQRHESYRGGRVLAADVRIVDGDHRFHADMTVDLRITQLKLITLGPHGKVEHADRTDSKAVRYRAFLRRVGSGWRLCYFGQIVYR